MLKMSQHSAVRRAGHSIFDSRGYEEGEKPKTKTTRRKASGASRYCGRIR
jgi:hypothetical protein